MKEIIIKLTKPDKDYNNEYDVCAITSFDDEAHSGGVYKFDDFFKDLKRNIGNLENPQIMNDQEQKAVDNVLEDLQRFSSKEVRNIVNEIIEVKLGGKL